MTEFKVNEYLTLKLEEGKTNIYIKNEVFNQCKHLKIKELRTLESVTITPEIDFWGHCSVLQAWAENDYSFDLLNKHYAFLLLKKLRRAGDFLAMKILKSLKHCIYCGKKRRIDEIYCPNCRKFIFIPDLADEGWKFLRDLQCEKAISIFKAALKEDPQDLAALNYLGIYYMNLNQNRVALRIFKKALSFDQSSESSNYSILTIYIQANKYDKARILTKELIKKYPRIHLFHVLRGQYHASVANYREAEKSYNKAFHSPSDKYKTDFTAYLGLGEIFNEKCEFRNALNVISRGLVHYENQFNLMFLKSHIHTNKGDYDKAMHILTDLLRIVPKISHDGINSLLGKIYLVKGQYYKAIHCYRKSFYTSRYSYRLLSIFYDERRKYNIAIRLCEKAIRIHRDDANAWEILGKYHANIKQFDKAKRAINMALALDPYSNRIKLSLAYIYIKNEEYDNGIAICIKILEQIPLHFLGRLYMGYAFYGKKDFEKAMGFIKKALEVNPNSDSAKYFLAKIYFTQKNYNSALNLAKSRQNPYSRDFFHLVVEIMDEALKSHKICPNCGFLSKKRSNFCTICGYCFEQEA